jgi:hypothetical protein
MGAHMATNPISIQQLVNASDDAKALEHYVNDDVPALIPTRLGGQKPNYAKIVADISEDYDQFMVDRRSEFEQFLLSSGYQDLGDYAAALQFSARNQVFRKANELYRAAATLDLPYTTTGIWSEEQANFVAVGDAALRQELANVYGALGGAGMVGYKAGGLGTQVRPASERFDDVVSVRNYPLGSVDGVTSNQLGIEMAVSAALAQGAVLNWPVGIYISTDSIPNFHLVRHSGPGVIKRGGDVFRPTPLFDSLNTIYVSNAGQAGNDGLSAAQPVLTLQDAIDILPNYGPVLQGYWRIQMEAGTYARGRFSDEGLLSARPIEIRGPDVGGHPNVPTAVLSEGANGIVASGLVFRQYTRVKVKDIKVVGWNGSSSAQGITAGNYSEIYTDNVHASNCTWGVSGGDHSLVDVKGGIFEGNGYQPNGVAYTAGGGVRGLFHAKFAIGLQNAGTLSGGPIFRNNAYGVWAQEHNNGHLDWVTFEDNGTHVRLNILSRLNMDGSSLKRSEAVAVWADAGSVVSISDATVFGTGADANRINFLANGSSYVPPTSLLNNGILPATSARCVARVISNQTINSIAPTVLRQLSLRGQLWRDGAASNSGMKSLRYRLYGTLAGTAGYKRIQSRFGSTPLSVTFTSSETGLFVLEGRLMLNTNPVGSQLQILEATRSGAAMRIASGTTSEAMIADTVFNIEALVENVADSIFISAYEIYVDGL